MHRFAAAVLLLVPVVAVAQPTVTAEATAEARAKPDTARIAYSVSARNADSDLAASDTDDAMKEFVTAIEKLRLDGVKVKADPLRVDRMEFGNNRGVVGFGEFNAVRNVVVSVTESDPEKLVTLVEKVQKAAARQNVGGELGPSSYNGSQYERVGGVKVAYSRTEEGWADSTTAAIATATKRARQKAEALAGGAGLTLGELISVSELPAESDKPSLPTVTTSNSAAYLGGAINPGVTADTLDAFVDGELVRTVRVRVVYGTK